MLGMKLRCEGKLRGDALEMVHDNDRLANVEELTVELIDMEAALETLRHEHQWAKRKGDNALVHSLAESIDALIVLISGIEDGSITPSIEPYDEADRWHEPHGYGPAIDWRRWTEAEIAKSKRLRRLGL